MYCPNCGTNLPEGIQFCMNCGYDINKGTTSSAQPWQPNVPQRPPSPYGYSLPTKSELVAIILAIIVPGAGHLYIGKLVRGLVIMIAYFSISILSAVWIFNQIGNLTNMSDPDAIMNALGSSIGLISILSIATFIIWIFQLIDVYSLTKKYNEGLQRTGQAPW